MEWLLVELASYASTIVHTIFSFVMWLAVVVGTAFVLVYNRLASGAQQVVHVLHLDNEGTPEKKDDA